MQKMIAPTVALMALWVRVADGSAIRGSPKPPLPGLTHPQEDKKFYKKDYPIDEHPGRGNLGHGYPYPLMDESNKYDDDFVKDDDKDNGQWAAQMKYDILRNKVRKQKMVVKDAQDHAKQQFKEYVDARKWKEQMERDMLIQKIKKGEQAMEDAKAAMDAAEKEEDEATEAVKKSKQELETADKAADEAEKNLDDKQGDLKKVTDVVNAGNKQDAEAKPEEAAKQNETGKKEEANENKTNPVDEAGKELSKEVDLAQQEVDKETKDLEGCKQKLVDAHTKLNLLEEEKKKRLAVLNGEVQEKLADSDEKVKAAEKARAQVKARKAVAKKIIRNHKVAEIKKLDDNHQAEVKKLDEIKEKQKTAIAREQKQKEVLDQATKTHDEAVAEKKSLEDDLGKAIKSLKKFHNNGASPAGQVSLTLIAGLLFAVLML